MAENRSQQRKDDRARRFEALFRASYPRVLAYALRRTEGRDAAEEIASETFLIAWRRLEAVPEEPLPWLLGTARKVHANQRRSTRRSMPTGPHAPLSAVDARDPATSTADLVTDREAFATAFAALDERDREVLALTAWDGLTPREAARVLDCTAAAFSIRLHRARRRLLKELRSSGHSLAEDTSGALRRSPPGTAEAR